MFELLREIVHIATGILVVGSQRVLKISDQTNADFFQLQYIPNAWKNRIIVVPC